MTSAVAATPDRQPEVSTLRLYLLRSAFALNFGGLGALVWPELVNPDGLLTAYVGVAFSFWAALATLCGLGIRYPLRMLPLLMLQLLYKSLWLVAVALPLSSAGQLDADGAGLVRIFLMGAAMDVAVIPWGYVLTNYVRKPGDRWGGAARPASVDTAPTPA